MHNPSSLLHAATSYGGTPDGPGLGESPPEDDAAAEGGSEVAGGPAPGGPEKCPISCCGLGSASMRPCPKTRLRPRVPNIEPMYAEQKGRCLRIVDPEFIAYPNNKQF